jgi:hypothetical protein
MARLTSKKFLEFINEQFIKLEMPDWKAVAVENSYASSKEIEAGACRLRIKLENSKYPKHHLINHQMLCFYTLGQYQAHLRDGYEMYLTLPFRKMSVTDLTVELRKKTL